MKFIFEIYSMFQVRAYNVTESWPSSCCSNYVLLLTLLLLDGLNFDCRLDVGMLLKAGRSFQVLIFINIWILQMSLFYFPL